MSKVQKLPDVNSNTLSVVNVSSSVMAAFLNMMGLPGDLVKSAVKKYTDKKIEECRAILIAEMKRGNMEILNDEKAEQFIPACYKFYKAAWEGEAQHNLVILAKLLRGYLENEEAEFADYSNAAEALRGLSIAQLKLLSKYRDFDETFLLEISNGEITKSKIYNFNITIQDQYKDDFWEIKSLTNFLVSKCLLIELIYPLSSFETQDFDVILLYPSKQLIKIISLAGSLDLSDLTPNPSPKGEGD